MNLTKSIQLFEKEYIDSIEFDYKLDAQVLSGADVVITDITAYNYAITILRDAKAPNLALSELTELRNNLIVELETTVGNVLKEFENHFRWLRDNKYNRELYNEYLYLLKNNLRCEKCGGEGRYPTSTDSMGDPIYIIECGECNGSGLCSENKNNYYTYGSRCEAAYTECEELVEETVNGIKAVLAELKK